MAPNRAGNRSSGAVLRVVSATRVTGLSPAFTIKQKA